MSQAHTEKENWPNDLTIFLMYNMYDIYNDYVNI